MSDNGIIQMIIDKLDKIENKVEKINDKLTDFEVSAQTILTTHEIEIKNSKNEIEKLKHDIETVKNNSNSSNTVAATEKVVENIFYKFINSPVVTIGFRFLILFLLGLQFSGDKFKIIAGLLK